MTKRRKFEAVIDDAGEIRSVLQCAVADAGLSGYALGRAAEAEGICSAYTAECLMASDDSVRGRGGQRVPSIAVAVGLFRLAGCELVVRERR